MRWMLPLLVPALAGLAQADSGKLYIYDSHLQSASAVSKTVSPEAARLIIASRLGLDQFHDIGNLGEDTIQAINDLSADQHLFASSDAPSVALLLGEGLNQKDILATAGSHHVQTVHIRDIPSVAATEKFVTDLASQSGARGANDKALKASHLRDQLFTSPAGPLFRIANNEDDFMLVLDTLLRQDYTVLALTVPNDTASKHSYGKYDVSRKHAALHKRQQVQEAPLMTPSSHLEQPKLHTAKTPSANNSTPLRGILPQCFSSKSACESMTRNCTGHGACTLRWTDNDARPAAPCYSCSCSATVVTNKDGSKKTTKWGGPACQKKDVVMPFWLLGGFSVFMVALISWGIGMLLTMGNEELPSVIGSGVSGVARAK